MSFEFFADRNCGCHVFPEELRRANIVVHRHRDHFADDVNDEVWVPAVAAKGWIALSFDKNIRRNELERDAVFLSTARLILLTGANANAQQHAHNFINTFPAVEAFLRRHPAPFIARVKRPSPVSDVALGKPGAIEMRMTEAQWRTVFRGYP